MAKPEPELIPSDVLGGAGPREAGRAGLSGLNGYHLAPGSYLSEAASETSTCSLISNSSPKL